MLSKLDQLANWVRENSLWPMPFATACCGIELMATGASRHDIARFGAEVMRFSPAAVRSDDRRRPGGHEDAAGVATHLAANAGAEMVHFDGGVCLVSGGVFDTYAVVQGIDRFMPVDMYVPGCPPRPEQLMQSIIDLQDKIKRPAPSTGTEFAKRTQVARARSLDVEVPPADADGRAGRFRARRRACVALTSLRLGLDVHARLTTTIIDKLQARTFGADSFTTSEFRDNRRVIVPPAQVFDVLECPEGRVRLRHARRVERPPIICKYPERQGSLSASFTGCSTHDRRTTRGSRRSLNDPDLTLPSVFSLWKGADWLEREVYDMYGVVFDGHPDLRRILMPEEFTAFPLRKDYPMRGKGERHNFPVITRAES